MDEPERIASDVLSKFRRISEFALLPPDSPLTVSQRQLDLNEVGGKACGLALLPRAWTPPFMVVSAKAYTHWKLLNQRDRRQFLEAIAQSLTDSCRQWSVQWPAGLAFRSSAVGETIRERGAYESTQTTADYGMEIISSALEQIFRCFEQSGDLGSIAVVVQARAETNYSGHMSNERRVSKTVNQWMWEADEPWEGGERFNSQRATPPSPTVPLRFELPHNAASLKKLLQQIARWCTALMNGPCHLEWGLAGDAVWLFQIDFEDDQPDLGVDPRQLPVIPDTGPSRDPPAGSTFNKAIFDGNTGWPKIDKVRQFLLGRTHPYPSLYYATGNEIERALAAGRDLSDEIRRITSDKAVCRTECLSEKIERLNLPRTDTVTASEAVAFFVRTLSEMRSDGIRPEEICFIVHKFIPARVAAWALARPDSQIVLVDSIWGLPDGLSYLSHDTFEFDVKRKAVSAERLRHKPLFLQETAKGEWQLSQVSRRSTRHRSLSARDLREVAEVTHSISARLEKAVQVMWFCEIPETAGIGRNIPWFMQDAAFQPPEAETRVAPSTNRFVVRNLEDLSNFPRNNCVMDLEPEVGLFRDSKFLNAVITLAVERSVPVILRGSVLGHAFYTLQRGGVSIVESDSRRTRTRRKQAFGKLVRDEIPARIQEQGELAITAHIAKSQARVALVSKLYEESQELLSAREPDDVRAELADIVEVVRSLCLATGINWQDVERAAEAKRQSRGSFESNVVLLETSWPAWKERPKNDTKSLINFQELAKVTGQRGHYSVNFPGLVAAGTGTLVVLSDGKEIRVRLSVRGLEIEEVDSEEPTTSQLEFDFPEQDPET